MNNRNRAIHILAVDDSEATLEVLRRNLEAEGYIVFTSPGVAEALRVLESTQIDLVITDIKMPRVNGLDLVRHVRENLKTTEVTVITGHPSVDGAVAAMKKGAADYLTKPFTDEELRVVVSRALDRLEMRESNVEASKQDVPRHGLLGESDAIKHVFEQIARASRTRATVMITGESGTGKELVARAIHYESERAAAPFVPVNCGAIPHDLLESELFGHVKGSFTGATESRSGFFLTAEGGTVFLDEIAETSQTMQVKLLRVLQDKEVRMVGASRSTRVDVRIIVATNKDLALQVDEGSFREDLYFRINVIPIHVPPLRDRSTDVVLLAKHFAAKYANEFGREIPEFTNRVFQIFQEYSWPGNVRELENIIQRLMVMTSSDIIDAPDLPSLMRFSVSGMGADLTRTLDQMETGYIRDVLDSVDGNKTRAAQILGIDRKTLRTKLQRLEQTDKRT